MYWNEYEAAVENLDLPFFQLHPERNDRNRQFGVMPASAHVTVSRQHIVMDTEEGPEMT
jgi:hypothetical protein